MASISPIFKKCKTLILALKSPTYRDFMIKKKSLKSKTSKSHTWAPLNEYGFKPEFESQVQKIEPSISSLISSLSVI
jgi:hypothetical protein